MDGATPLASEDTVPSSPVAAGATASFSDNPTRSSSPPSSPPGFPWEQQHASPRTDKPTSAQANAFSLLGKRKALEDISDNAQPSKKFVASKPAPKALSQMQISLGQTTQKKCKICGMEYVPSASEDRKLHDKYHKQNVEGYDVGKDFVRRTLEDAVFSGVRKEDAICVLDCYDTPSRKRRGQAVLEIVQRELGAVEIPEDELWTPPKASQKDTRAKFQMYLYIRATKCVGLLLAQRIEEAFRVLEPPSTPTNVSEHDPKHPRTAASKLKARQQAMVQHLKQPLQLSKERRPARLGISRVWTSSMHRRGTIATALLQAALDCGQRCPSRLKAAQTNLAIGTDKDISPNALEVQPSNAASAMAGLHTREDMAFSQPTDAGTKLARKWFGKNYGWAVYLE